MMRSAFLHVGRNFNRIFNYTGRKCLVAIPKSSLHSVYGLNLSVVSRNISSLNVNTVSNPDIHVSNDSQSSIFSEESDFGNQQQLADRLFFNDKRTDVNKVINRKEYLKQYEKDLNQTDEAFSTEKAIYMLQASGRNMLLEPVACRNELTQQVWDVIQKNETPQNIELWNTFLSVQLENRSSVDPLDFLKQLSTSNLEPDKSTFLLLSKAYADRGDPDGVMKIIDFMMKHGTLLSEEFYAVLIKAHANRQDFIGIDKILQSMGESNVEPGQVTYGELLNVYAMKGDTEKLSQISEIMLNKRIYITSNMYLSMFDHLNMHGHIDLIPDIWLKKRTMVNLDHLNNLLIRWLVQGDFKSTVTLANLSFKNDMRKRMKLKNFIYRAMLLAEKSLEDFDQVTELMSSTFRERKKDSNLFLSMFFAHHDRLDLSLKVIKDLTMFFHYPMILKALVADENMTGIADVFKDMKSKGFRPNDKCRDIIKPIVGEPGSELYKKFQEASKAPNLIYQRKIDFVVRDYLREGNLTLKALAEKVEVAEEADLFTSLQNIKEAVITNFDPDNAAKIVATLHLRNMKNTARFVSSVVNSSSHLQYNRTIVLKQNLFIKTLIEKGVPVLKGTIRGHLKNLSLFSLGQRFDELLELLASKNIDHKLEEMQMLQMSTEAGAIDTAQSTYDQLMQQEDQSKNHEWFHDRLITAYFKRTEVEKKNKKYHQKIVEIGELMEKDEMRFSHLSVTAVIVSYLAAGNTDNALKFLCKHGHGLNKKRKFTNFRMLRGFIDNQEYTAAESYFEDSHPYTSVYHYNEMLRMYEMQGDQEKFKGMLEDMKKRGLKPNSYTEQRTKSMFSECDHYDINMPVSDIEMLKTASATPITSDVNLNTNDVNSAFDGVDSAFDDVNSAFDDVNSVFDDVTLHTDADLPNDQENTEEK